MTQTLMHYASSPITFDPSREYRQNKPRCFGKPEGLWVSVLGEDDWPTWCESEGSFTNTLAAAHQVTLRPDAAIRRISTPAGIDSFHETYAIHTDFEFRYGVGHHRWPIDWARVVTEYDGIIIAPYQYSRRFSPDWYYGWDCASGCIWNLDAIVAVEQTDTPSLTAVTP